MLPKPNYDQALKQLLLKAHDSFLALIAPTVRWRGALSPELPAAGRQADLVWEVQLGDGSRGILHIELQTKPDPTMGERVAEYLIRLWQREHVPMQSIVVFLRPAETLPEPPFVIPWEGNSALTCSYQSIRLWEYDPEQVLQSNDYNIWPVAALMAGTTADSTIAIAERLAAAPLPRRERSELAGTLILLAGLRVPRAALADALRRAHMIEDIWKESSFAEAVYDVASEEGVARQVAPRAAPRACIRLPVWRLRAASER